MKLYYYPLTLDVKVFGTTSRYIQGPGVIKLLGKVLSEYRFRKAFVFADDIVMKVIERHGLFKSLEEVGMSYIKV